MPVTINQPDKNFKKNIFLTKMKQLKLIGFDYLLLIAATQFIFRYGFLEQQAGLPIALNDWQYALFVLATVFIAAGGFLINNVINKGHKFTISEGTGYNIYGFLTLSALGIGYYISDYINRPAFLLVFAATAGSLYFYATNLRKSLLLGNLIISLMSGLILLSIGVFNLYPVIIPENQSYLKTIFEVLLDYSFFALIITFIITILKDLKDSDADYNDGLSTLPIAMGKDRTVKIAFFLSLLPLGMLLYYGTEYIASLIWAMGYGLFFIACPLIYFSIKLWGAKTNKDFAHLLTVLKLVLILSAISIAVITFNIHYNAQG